MSAAWARSVQRFTDAYRARGHEVLVIAPTFADAQEDEPGVMRVKAIEDVFSSGFSMALPVPARVREAVEDFGPDIVHSHHPILLGDTALRLAATHDVPIVFTHHTMYEHYTHYYPGDSEPLPPVRHRIATGLCQSLRHVCSHRRRACAHTDPRPRAVDGADRGGATGGDLVAAFRADGDGRAGAACAGRVPENAFVVGHLGRWRRKEPGLDGAGAIPALRGRPAGHPRSDCGKGRRWHRCGPRFQRRHWTNGYVHGFHFVRGRPVDAYHAIGRSSLASKGEDPGHGRHRVDRPPRAGGSALTPPAVRRGCVVSTAERPAGHGRDLRMRFSVH